MISGIRSGKTVTSSQLAVRVPLLAAAFLAVICAAADAGETLYRRLEAEPLTLNPILETSAVEESILGLLSRKLLDIDEHLNLVGGLCDDWSVSSDLRRYTLHLRSNATWEDGTPVTSHDAALTLRLIADPKIPAMRFATALESFTGVRELDTKTLEVTFAKPYALRLLAFHFGLLPARRYEHHDVLQAPENRSPLANGPYRIRSWRTGQEIRLVRNDRYWGTRAPFEEVVFRILPDQTQAYRSLTRSLIDETRLSAEQAMGAARDARFQACCRTLVVPDLTFLYVGYSQRVPAFRDARTRRALTMIVDRQAIVDHVYGGRGRVLSGPFPAELPAYDTSVPPYPYDPGAAARLLRDAGWESTSRGLVQDGVPFEFRLLYTAMSKSSREIAELLTAAWASAGITCHPVALDWAALTKQLDAGDFDAVLAAWTNDVNPDLFESWHSSQAAPRGLNSTGYANPRVDALIEASRAEPDPNRRLVLFHQLHRLLHEEAPATWVCEVGQQYGINKRLKDVRPSPIGLFRFWPGASAWTP